MAKEIEKKEISKSRPKLLIATDSYLPRWDGISSFLSQMMPLMKDTFDITVVAPNFYGRRSKVSGIKEILMPLTKFKIGDFDVPRLKKKEMKEAVKESDLIWTHTIGPIGRKVINTGRSMNKKIVSYIHSIEWELFSRALGKPVIYNPVSTFSRRFVKSMYSKCDVLMMPSHESINLFKWYKIRTKMIFTPLGIDSKTFIPAKSKIEAKKKLSFEPNSKVIGFCGRIAHEKDLRTLVRAYQRQRDNYDDLRLLLIGDGLEELKSKFSKIRGVTLVGAKDNVVPYYQAMDIYVLSSLTETTSLSTLEAMSCEVPVIVTPVGEVKNYVKNNRNGFVFSKGDSFQLSRYIETLLEDDKLRNRLGKNGRITVENKYSWEASSKEITDRLIGQIEHNKK